MFMQARSVGIRLWHWLDAGVVFALLGTVLLRNTLISPRDNATLIREKIEGAGAAVTADQARAAARALNDNLWAWHVYLGYALAALALARIVVVIADRGRPPAPSGHDGGPSKGPSIPPIRAPAVGGVVISPRAWRDPSRFPFGQ